MAAALISGAGWGGATPSPEHAGLVAASCLTAAFVVRRHRWSAALFLAFAAAAAGAALQGVGWRAADRRLEATFGGSSSRDLGGVARVLAAPERDRESGRSLLVEMAPTAAAPRLTLRLDVVTVPADDAARIDALRRGDRVRVWCRLRAPEAGPGASASDAKRRLAAQRLAATGRVKSSRLVTLVSTGSLGPGRILDQARCRARGALDRALGDDGDARAVLGAMLLGDRLLLDERTNALLRDAGLIHILSISGLHTALSVVLLFALLRRSRLGPKGVLVIGAVSLAGFSALVGHGASVWRACAGLAVGLLARALHREVDALTALSLAGAALVVAVPPLAWNAGFLLSITATAGLVAATSSRPGDDTRRSALALSLRASSGAYLATAPLLASLFGRLAPAALAANLVAAPLCAACLAAGAATIFLAWVPVAGGLAAGVARCAVAALLLVSRLASSLPAGHFRVAAPPAWLDGSYVWLLLLIGSCRRSTSRAAERAIALLFALCVIALHLGPPPPGPGDLTLNILDVGQGLAVVVQGPDGSFLLADAGPSGGEHFDAGDRIVVPELAALGCRRLEVLALSHDHDDHSGGVSAVLRDLEVGELWVGEGSERDPITRVVVADAIARGVAVRRLQRGDRTRRVGLELEVLHPGIGDRDRSLNDRCLVLRARPADGAAVLLPGDLEVSGEAALLASGAAPRADVLVAPHHGANGSSSRRFLAEVAPRFVLVSAGRGNRFGHPGLGALSRFRAIGAEVLRTDRNGTIALQERDGRWMPSVERDGRGDERQDEDDRQDDREEDSRGAERLGLVDESGMTVSERQQDEEPEAVGRRGAGENALNDDERGDDPDGHEREEAMRSRRASEQRVAAIQLPDGEEVHRGDEHPDPRRTVDRAHLELGDAVKRFLEDPRDQRGSQREAVKRLGRGELDRGRDAVDHERQGDDESRDRSRRRDVEQRLP